MLDIWFLFDNLTFKKVTARDAAGLAHCAADLFNEDGCGSLFVRDQHGDSIQSLTLHGRLMAGGRYGIPKDEIERWADTIVLEVSFRKMMVA